MCASCISFFCGDRSGNRAVILLCENGQNTQHQRITFWHRRYPGNTFPFGGGDNRSTAYLAFVYLPFIERVIVWENCKSVSWFPPVSVFDTKQGYWQKRKREWKAFGLDSGVGREKGLLGDGLEALAKKNGMNLTGTSIFDPVLCEVLYNWFCVEKGTVFDPFAGGSVRGVVAEMLNRRYIGIDLSEKQIDANRQNADRLGVFPAWFCDDSKNADLYIDDGTADMVFSCPPYFDLERYSDHPLDLSNMNYTDFLKAYREIISISCRKLKQDRFAVFVVGDVRDKKGAYRDFIGVTKTAFREAGLCLYNEFVLLEQYGTAPMRAGAQFSAKRKVAKVHQNVLVFYKGDIEAIKGTFKCDFRFADLRKEMM